MWNMMKEEADQSQWPCGKVQGNANSFCYADSLGMLSQNQTIFFLTFKKRRGTFPTGSRFSRTTILKGSQNR